MKVALVYDRINKWGGAERVLLALHKIWPNAPLFTSVYNSKTAPWAKEFKVASSFLQKFPLAKNNHEIYAPLMPLAFESFNFNEYDIVVSVTSEAAKGIITNPKTLHICYCLTPTRYLWSGFENYFDSEIRKYLSEEIINHQREWDKIASTRPDLFVAISKTVKDRIKKYYSLESKVIYPPVKTKEFRILSNELKNKEKYFLVVSRLVKYKKVEMVIEVFNELGWNLKIIGTGREELNLRKRAKNNIAFLGQLTDSELLSYYQNCQAVIFPQEEDFGIVPLEAQACGRPVIAFWGGGAAETIIDKKTGLFFYPQTKFELKKALLIFEIRKFNSHNCRKQAEKFSEEKFIKEFKDYTKKQWKKHTKTISMH